MSSSRREGLIRGDGDSRVGTPSARALAPASPRFPDVHYGDGGRFVAGERGVSEWTLTGTTVHGARLNVRGCDIWTFSGIEVHVKNSFWKIVES